MKKSVCIIVLSLVYVLAFVSCEREQYSTEEGNKVETVSEGQINLSSLKLTVNVNANAATRADIDTKDYIIRIYNRDNDNKLLQEWKYSEMPEIFSLKVGNYTVAAFSHDVHPAEFEHPYYYGKEDFEILKDQITDIIDLQCVLRSVMVTVEYDEKLLTLLGNDVKANVTLGQGSLDFVKDETRAGYYQAINENANVITTRLTGTVEGESVDISKGFPQVKAGAHKIIRYTLKDVDENGSSEGGNADISIRIDVTCTTVEQDIFLTISCIFFLAAAVFVKEYLSADFFGTVPIFIRGIFLHKCFIRGAAVSMCIWNDFGSIFCIMERISFNVFIHSAGAFVFRTVVSKEDDFFAGVCIIIKNTGIIRDQYITEI